MSKRANAAVFKDTERQCKTNARLQQSIANANAKQNIYLADMQVLDYLCGNVDRHGANLVYQLDDNGKIIGIQGIDNDSSFARFSGQMKAVNRLFGLEQMNVMSAGPWEPFSRFVCSQASSTLRSAITDYIIED